VPTRVNRPMSAAWLCVALFSACSSGSHGTTPAVAEKAPIPVAASSGTGPFTVRGTAPPPSGGFPAIVVLDPETVSDEPQAQPFVPYMDQVQQTFIPSLLLVRTGQPVEFRNNDDVLHNVRVRNDETRSPAFNVAIPTGEKYQFSFERDGFYDVGCDIHPGMTSQIVATSSPFITTGDAQGRFTIEHVPSGSYKAIVYAGAQKIERVVAIAAASTDLDLTHP
jgi:plastocyanin